MMGTGSLLIGALGVFASYWFPRAAGQTVYPFDSHWKLQYSAYISGSQMVINPSVLSAGGIAWYDVPMYISDFTGSFDFYMGDPSNPVRCAE